MSAVSARARGGSWRSLMQGALLLLGVGAALLIPLLAGSPHLPWFLCEFRGDLYNAGQSILHGRNPYDPAYIAAQAAIARTGGHPVTNFILPVYPAPTLLVAAPLSLLPFSVAGTLYLSLSAAALLASVRLLGVRDRRCVAAMLFSAPVLLALIDGALTPLLVLGVALAWRWRARAARVAAVIAALVVAKLFLWPLLAWMLITRRLRVLAASLTLAGTATVLGWGAIGFAGIGRYPHMLAQLSQVEAGAGVSLVAGLHAIGLSLSAATAIATGGALSLVAMAWRLMRQHGDERRAFALLILAALAATPIAWANYLVLLYIPIALISPRFSWLWLLPLLAYAAPQPQSHGHLVAILPYLLPEGAVLAAVLSRRSPGGVVIAERRVPAVTPAARML